MIGLFNRVSHVAIGAWVGSAINNPRYRVGLCALVLIFLAYQGFEAWRKGDQAYGEVKEFGLGMALPLIWTRFQEWRVGR